MAGKTKTVAEQIVDTSLSGGQGAVVPEPVDTGDVHANRPQDNANGEANVADVRGQDVPRAALINAIVAQLVGMDNADLSQIVSQISTSQDATAPGAAAAPVGGDQARNLASITTKEDVEELFAGEDLSEEYKERATVIFEATVEARVAMERVAIQEQAEKDVEEAVESMTEELVNQIDKYLTFAAEQFVETNKAALETATRNTIAEQFLKDVAALVEKYNIESNPETVATNEAHEATVAELNAKLNEQVEALVAANIELKAFRQKEAFAAVAESLTPLQRNRFEKLAETVEFDSVEGYQSRLAVIKEAVVRTKGDAAPAAVVIAEETNDGVPSATEVTETAKVNKDPVVASVLSLLTRQH